MHFCSEKKGRGRFVGDCVVSEEEKGVPVKKKKRSVVRKKIEGSLQQKKCWVKIRVD